MLEGELLAIQERPKIAKERHFYTLQIATCSLLVVKAVINPNVTNEFELLKFWSLWTKLDPRNSYHVRRRIWWRITLLNFLLYPQIILFGRVKFFYLVEISYIWKFKALKVQDFYQKKKKNLSKIEKIMIDNI